MLGLRQKRFCLPLYDIFLTSETSHKILHV